jgi:hypothetical protein
MPSPRFAWVHVYALPSYAGIGVVRSAAQIYMDLDMWDEAVRCYQVIACDVMSTTFSPVMAFVNHVFSTTSSPPWHFHHVIFTTSFSLRHLRHIISSTSSPPRHLLHVISATSSPPRHLIRILYPPRARATTRRLKRWCESSWR